MAFCGFNVTVDPCTTVCPANITKCNDTNQCGAVVTYSVPTAAPACGPVTCSPGSGSFFPKGTTVVSCKTTIGPSCSFTVTVNDCQAPIITCPADVISTAAASCPIQTSAPINFAPTASDNCPGVTIVCTNQNNQIVTSGSSFPVGTTTVTCKATDTSGNSASCSFTINVFSACLQDDSDPNRVVQFNARTGEYRFCCGGTTFTGQGMVTARGCIATIQHNGPDRRVQITFDGSVNAGSASLQFPPGTIRCTIQDRNTRNNSCVCQ